MAFESPQNSSQKNSNLLPFNFQSEMVWWPYQSLSKSLLQTHHNASALIEINRMLADEMRNIARREQDFVFELSERILNRKNDGDHKPPETVDEIFESAISGIRQFNQAVVDAQVRSIEAFHRHAREAVDQKHQQAAE
ncbi:MAG TPA: hypothetical protein VN685_06385 [Rhizomicrobium sp.]|jgi:hypothetical protein|nr:hypothetical protein [Rhizomicrobium sp.]